MAFVRMQTYTDSSSRPFPPNVFWWEPRICFIENPPTYLAARSGPSVGWRGSSEPFSRDACITLVLIGRSGMESCSVRACDGQ